MSAVQKRTLAQRRVAHFDTPIGRCAIAWTDAGICALELPREDERGPRTLPVPLADTQAVPSAAVSRVALRVQKVLGGESDALTGVVLDFGDMPPFHRRVYEAVRAIPFGATLTYGDVARGLGAPAMVREVGYALGRNPFPIIVPCHRVVGAGGKLVGFSAPGGLATKQRLLAIEAGQSSLF